MSDIFREVEEEVRRERLEKIWKQYGDYIIAAIAVVIIAAAGWQLWKYYDQKQRLKASDEYAAAEQMMQAHNYDKAAEAFANLAKSAPSGYSALARLQEANALLGGGKYQDAIALYKKIAADDDTMLGNIARIRAGWAMAGTASKTDLQTWLAPLTDPTNDWHYSANEILALADYRTGDMKSAEAAFRHLADDTKAPTGLRQRCKAMADFIAAGGDKEYGSVPPAAKPPATDTTAAPTDAAPPAAPKGPKGSKSK